MSIFGIIKSDDKVFKGDKLRIEVGESFLAPTLLFGTVSHEISIDSGLTYYNISSTKKVDWIFSTAGDTTITLRLTTSLGLTQLFTKTVLVIDQVTQKLFSKDSDLYRYEPEVDQYMPKKWSSWNIIHLAAQEWIMDWLDEKGIYKQDGTKYIVSNLLDTQQVKQLSCYKVLEMIFAGNSNVAGDIFSIKRDKYRELVIEKASRSNLQLDFNSDTLASVDERTNLQAVLIRRA